MTRLQLSKLFGISQPQISLMEHGETIVKLSRILGVERTKSRGSSAPRGKFWKAFQLAARLPERDQRAVARLISSLASGQGLRSEDDSSRARRAS